MNAFERWVVVVLINLVPHILQLRQASIIITDLQRYLMRILVRVFQKSAFLVIFNELLVY